jgi:hypothetical protein
MSRVEVRRVVGSASIGTLSSEQGLELLDRAIACDEAVVLAAPLDMRVLRAEARAGAVTPLLSGLVGAAPRKASGGEAATLASRIAAMAEDERAEALVELVRVEAAHVLGLSSPNTVSPGRAFKQAGFDSLAAVELRNRLGAATGLRLPATLVFDYPDPRRLAGYLLDELDREREEPSLDRALDEIERMISTVSRDQSDRQRTAARLRTYLAALDGGPDGEDLSSASDAEMFEILDAELGAL